MEIVDSLMVKIALIGLLGIGAQWIAWRTGRPAIALMLIVGIIAGPVLGIIDPARDFGALQEPIIKLAVAVILFEGGLSLNFRELRQAGGAVLAMVFIAGPIAWALGTGAAHYGAGLSWEISALLGGIMIVTGPTVVGPMLRTLRVPSRVRNILKWEGIVNDPIGALLAVGIYAYITYEGANANIAVISMDVLAASFVAGLIGAGLGFAVTWLFPRGLVPEYLKAPFLLVTVIAGFVIADLIKHETGLITVTVMGIVMANRQIYSSQALYRFKEDLAVLLISGVFIILSATLDWETVQQFRPQFVIFLILLLFVVRPVSVLVALLFSSVPWRERLFIAWIAPRGIVAVAITGLFAIRLVDHGFPGAEALVPLSFAVVIATIFAHGFSASWVAERLGISEGKGEGVLIAGANRWSIALGKMLKSLNIDVLITDNSKFALRRAHSEGLAIRHGDVLEEAHDDNI
ncbi:cation:proton antiporter, partial [Parasphingorhabdus sp.]|uniref:cation:proton antiporter n=1 Tax=Parasphingorhabdus sp. TaxID=2709688 RepID=UPI00300296A3